MQKLAVSLLLGTVLLAACQNDVSTQYVEKTNDGIIVTPTGDAASKVRLQILSDDIIRVTASPDENFVRSKSLMLDPSLVGGEHKAAFEIAENDTSVRVNLKSASAEVSLETGAVRFFDANGKETLAERGTRKFTPVTIDGKQHYTVKQVFAPGAGDAFYGLGQHQNGQFNYRGENVELAQHNISIAAPFLSSTDGYGILWDNNSITRFGDERPYQGLDETLIVRTPDHKEGGLLGVYFKDGQEVARTQEGDPDYEFLDPEQFTKHNGQRNVWPEPLVDVSPDKVVWSGSLEAKTSGTHKFRVYASHYIKVKVGGKTVVDRWRQNWNPYYFNFDVEMIKGEPQTVEIEWLPNDGYFRMGHLDPVADHDPQDLTLSSEVADVIDYYYVGGETLDDVVSGYRDLTGKAVMLPRWAYGYWQSRQRYKTQDELLGVLAEYRKREIPIDNIVLDWFYWPEDAWGSHAFDMNRFPDPKQMVDKVHEMNANIMISVWPKFYPTTDNYKELEQAGHVYKRNLEYETLDWVGKGYKNTFYDPYTKTARNLYWRQMQEKLGVLGIDAWWMDATEPDMHSNLSHEERKLRMGPTAVGSGSEYFNTYALMNAQAVYEGERSGADGDERVFILTRSGFPGLQRYGAAAWSGDVVARWDDLKEQISAGLNFTLTGMPNWTFDIGGFAVEERYTNKDPAHVAEWQELNLRWFQLGAFAPVFRSHGEFPFREVFNLAEEGSAAYESFVHYDKLRYRLMPYIYSQAAGTYHKDGSIMRAMVMDFSDDKTTHDLGEQFMFGSSLLVAPVYEFKQRTQKVYLPKGNSWHNFDTGDITAGGQWINVDAPLYRVPLFAKSGAIIPTGPKAQYVAQALNTDLTLSVYSGSDGEYVLFEDDGETYAYERGEFSKIKFTYDDTTGKVTIGPRTGAFEGMAVSRTINIRWIGARPDEMRINYNGETLIVDRP